MKLSLIERLALASWLKIALAAFLGSAMITHFFGGIPENMVVPWLVSWGAVGYITGTLDSSRANKRRLKELEGESERISLVGHVPEKEVDRAE